MKGPDSLRLYPGCPVVPGITYEPCGELSVAPNNPTDGVRQSARGSDSLRSCSDCPTVLRDDLTGLFGYNLGPFDHPDQTVRERVRSTGCPQHKFSNHLSSNGLSHLWHIKATACHHPCMRLDIFRPLGSQKNSPRQWDAVPVCLRGLYRMPPLIVLEQKAGIMITEHLSPTS